MDPLSDALNKSSVLLFSLVDFKFPFKDHIIIEFQS